QYPGERGADVTVKRCVRIDVAGVKALRPSHILISPGPCTPDEAGISLELVRTCGGSIPILGVCLGHQAIGQVYGGKVVHAGRVMHGKTSMVCHDGKDVLRGMPSTYDVTRYHSLVIE